jgi:hypothetical protein
MTRRAAYLRDSARLLAVAAALAAAGCEDDASLWGDAMSPTQMQRADQGPPPVGNYFATTSGDSEDPFVENASYPFVQGPWWSNPAYNGG